MVQVATKLVVFSALLSFLFMYLVVIAWLYVTLMMALVEATNSNGSVLGAAVTFVFYGLLPAGLVGYILATPTRKRLRQAREQAQLAAWQAAQPTSETAPPAPSAQPDTGSHAACAAQSPSVTSVREKT